MDIDDFFICFYGEKGAVFLYAAPFYLLGVLNEFTYYVNIMRNK